MLVRCVPKELLCLFPGDKVNCKFTKCKLFPKIKIVTFLRRKLSELHKKDTVLDVAITVFLKTGSNKSKQRTHYSTLKMKKHAMKKLKKETELSLS